VITIFSQQHINSQDALQTGSHSRRAASLRTVDSDMQLGEKSVFSLFEGAT